MPLLTNADIKRIRDSGYAVLIKFLSVHHSSPLFPTFAAINTAIYSVHTTDMIAAGMLVPVAGLSAIVVR